MSLDGCYEGDEEKRNLSGDVCPYSTPLKGFRVLRGCLLQRREMTGPSGYTEYLVRCTSSGYVKHFKECHYYNARAKDLISRSIKVDDINSVEPCVTCMKRLDR
jgi:hypothetical protein